VLRHEHQQGHVAYGHTLLKIKDAIAL
jgi:hypothetical protein